MTLTAGLANLLTRDGHWAQASDRHEAAVKAARHLGDLSPAEHRPTEPVSTDGASYPSMLRNYGDVRRPERTTDGLPAVPRGGFDDED